MDRELGKLTSDSDKMDFYNKLRDAKGLVVRESDNYDLVIEVDNCEFAFFWFKDDSGELVYDGHSRKV